MNEITSKLARIRVLAEELVKLGGEVGSTSTNISMHGDTLPEGVEVCGGRLTVCYGDMGHGSFIRGYVGAVEFFASRNATQEEIDEEKDHVPRCKLFRLEAYREKR